MNRIVCTALAFTLVFLVDNARAARWSSGGKVGVNVATLSGDIDGTVSTKTGGMGGVFAEAGFSPQWAGRLELLIVQKGATIESGGIVLEATNSYLELPVLAVMKFPGNGRLIPSVFAGPTFGFNIAENIDLGGASGSDDGIEGFEFGVTLGAGLELPVDSISFVLDGRYTLGLTDITDTLGTGDSARNRGIGIMAGLSFPLGAQN